MKQIIIIGCGGHANSCAEILENSNGYSIFGFICNSKNKKNSTIKLNSETFAATATAGTGGIFNS
jgi:saccharopine dehydrogenase-like NADP-dependent oxidoreductase